MIGTILKLSPRTCLRKGRCISKLCSFSSSFFVKGFSYISPLRVLMAWLREGYFQCRLRCCRWASPVMSRLRNWLHPDICNGMGLREKLVVFEWRRERGTCSSRLQSDHCIWTLHEDLLWPWSFCWLFSLIFELWRGFLTIPATACLLNEWNSTVVGVPRACMKGGSNDLVRLHLIIISLISKSAYAMIFLSNYR